MVPQTSPPDSGHAAPSDGFVLRHRTTILFLTSALCLAGGYAAYVMPAAVFPQTDFPRVVILIDNGVMPADEMMATITRPVEEAMKNIPGTATSVRPPGGVRRRSTCSSTGRRTWSKPSCTCLGRLAQIRGTLPATAEIAVHRLTFSAFPILGISLTSKTRTIAESVGDRPL